MTDLTYDIREEHTPRAKTRLISAAPDMLLALRLILSDPYLSDSVNHDRPCVMAAIKAIEKATNKAP